MLNRKLKKRGGFTLIEIMLVIVIIGIIVGIAAPKIGGKLGKAQNVAARASLKAVETAVQSYEMDNLRLPDSLDDLTKQKDGNGPYLKPSELMDPWSQKFQYSKGGAHGMGFDLSTTSPDGEQFNNWD
ncbi:MAG: type II secretion system protein GspG [Kiritimatiellales bacterium]|nr:type II secretion system protein GspG [Kiritimatiellota bacterium]MBL7011988.1 type II secretion system protein GspG [Kiritimatiellales bacterium]